MITLRSATVEQIPVELLIQKKTIDRQELDAWLHELVALEGWDILLVERNRLLIGVVILNANPLYSDLRVDTLIVDREQRTPTILREVFRALEAYTVALARQLGLRHVTWAAPDPAKQIARLSGSGHWPAYVLETRIRYDVKPEKECQRGDVRSAGELLDRPEAVPV